MSNISGLHMGSQVWISPLGTVITDGEVSNTVGDSFVPAPPELDATELPAGWKSLGLVETSEPVFAYKETVYEGFSNGVNVNEGQTYNKTKITRIDEKAFKFTLNEVTREAFVLSQERLAKGTKAFIEVWLYARHFDSLGEEGEQLLTTLTLRGKLKLLSPIKSLNDITKAEWQLDIVNNTLSDSNLDGLDALLTVKG